MRLLAKLHIWLGWIIAVPLLFWTVSGLVMVAKPIEEVRGTHLIKTEAKRPLPPGWLAAQLIEGEDRPVEMRTRMQNNSVVTSAIYADGKIERYFARSGERVPEIDMAAARTIVAMEIEGGDRIAETKFFDAEHAPFDLRRPIPVWQVTLEDGTHVYVGRDSGQIEAVRTRFWRVFDFFWGLHIMDLQEREDTHHPLLVAFTVLAVLMTLMGAVLMFRRRKARVKTRPAPETA
ncbi:PepSY domain-containing protein [Croceicoccus naphthovorans]|uniref:Membrane protein n=1 Tax=Croceicoccus naphthovorans TaxID=1348774 RepID=A0A0G3XGZ3_9SPHN|nr:PepSY domain-containing protein [Croceicoccus naphthovorans]AKM09618.1 membrane protein [Croceicoccus naphthovorans]MBB3989605.1 putative iron-regulated membrane protein [Croceicoccus naphthovorans]